MNGEHLLEFYQGNGEVYADESEGYFRPVRSELTAEMLDDHLAGTAGPFGFYLMDPTTHTVRTCCWDFDDHENSDEGLRRITNEAKVLVSDLKEQGLSPCIERSKGGRGYHVWLFFEEPQPGWRVRQLSRELYQGSAEFFPKQDRVREGGLGNLVRIPGCGRSEYLGGTTPQKASQSLCTALYERHGVSDVEPTQIPSQGEFEASEGDIRRAVAALRAIDPDLADDYHMWVKVGLALHATSDELFSAWDEWSQNSDKYDPVACVRKWETFHATPGGVGFGTLYHLARQFGWSDKPEDSNFISLSQAQTKAAEMGPPIYIPTGIEPLDASVDGVSPGELIIVGGRPNHGKSVFGMSMLETAARNGYRSLMVSIEMSDVELARRAELHPLPQGVRDNIFIVESDARLPNILSHISRAATELGVSVVCVDYAQLIRSGNSNGKRHEIADAAEALKQLCREHGITIVLLSQLKRTVSERDSDAIPRSSDLSESGALENAADMILLLWYNSKEDPESPRDMYSIYVTKRRNGTIRDNIVTCTFYASEQRFGGRWTIAD